VSRLIKPLHFRWANHHDKHFKPGDPEVTFTLPVGTEVTVITTRQMEAGKVFDYVVLTMCDISYVNPLSGAISHAVVTADYVE
jgi:hypothetical protein